MEFIEAIITATLSFFKMLPLIIIIGIIIGIICVVSNISQKRKYDKNQLSIADTEIEDNIFTSIWEEEPEDWEYQVAGM